MKEVFRVPGALWYGSRGAGRREITLVDSGAFYRKHRRERRHHGGSILRSLFRGAILGDRIRMQTLSSTKACHPVDGHAGNLGGLASGTVDGLRFAMQGFQKICGNGWCRPGRSEIV